MGAPADKEMAVIRRCLSALDSLDAEGKDRAVQYLAERCGYSVTPKARPEQLKAARHSV